MQNLLHVYTGDGKGKTTAAMGLAMRVLGHGQTVLVAQFMKRPNSGELVSLGKLSGATVYPMPPMLLFSFQMTSEQLEEVRRSQTAEAENIIKIAAELQPALTVLDELAVAMDQRLVPEEVAMRLIDEALKWGDVVVTGRGASDTLIARADYVSRIEAVKHPFHSGIPARKGIEW